MEERPVRPDDAVSTLPMVPLRESTQNLIKAEHVNALPNGCLVVLVTRALICDMRALRARVLADEDLGRAFQVTLAVPPHVPLLEAPDELPFAAHLLVVLLGDMLNGESTYYLLKAGRDPARHINRRLGLGSRGHAVVQVRCGPSQDRFPLLT